MMNKKITALLVSAAILPVSVALADVSNLQGTHCTMDGSYCQFDDNGIAYYDHLKRGTYICTFNSRYSSQHAVIYPIGGTLYNPLLGVKLYNTAPTSIKIVACKKGEGQLKIQRVIKWHKGRKPASVVCYLATMPEK